MRIEDNDNYGVTENNIISSQQYAISLAVGAVAYLLTMLFGIGWMDGVAIGIFVFSLVLLILRLGYSIPIKELAFFLAALQWLLGPVLQYASINQHFKYYMYVGKETYMPFAMWGTLAFGLGLFIFDSRKQYLLKSYFIENIIEKIQAQPKLPYFLIIAGIGFSFLTVIAPSSLKFLFGSIGELKYIGIIYLLFSKDERKWGFLLVAILLTVLSSINAAMFHNLILWVVFIGMYVFISVTVKLRVKILSFFVVMMLMFAVILVKGSFRQKVWLNSYSGSKVTLFFDLLGEKTKSNPESIDEELQGIIYRINQGWIISAVMNYIPRVQPYLEGESVKKALYATVVPRFFDSSKQKAGGQDYFERFTGINLETSSMGVSLLGEGYANFGFQGALLFLFIIGSLICFVMNMIYRAAFKYPTIILWIPLIFFQVVKAESDLLRVLNHLVKVTIIVLVIVWILRKVFNYRL
jgi:hypothetical protein